AVPCIFIGGCSQPRSEGFRVRAVFAGWRGGVIPAHSPFIDAEKETMALAPMLAAALAVSEAFFHVQGTKLVAGRRSIGFSLWNTNRIDWQTPDVDVPPLRYLPSQLWLIGLGHLGQAYLWALSLLPYLKRDELSLVLQDIDKITRSTESTSILSEARMVG